MSLYPHLRCLPLLFVFGLAACGSSSSDKTKNNPAPAANTSVTVAGTVSKGLVQGASVRIFGLSVSSGNKELAGPFITDAAGRWQGSLTTDVAGPFMVLASGGSYIDEASGNTVTLGGGEIKGIMSSAQQTEIPLTPYSTAMLDAVLKRMMQGSSADSAVQNVKKDVVAALGFDPSVDVPANPDKVTAQDTVAAKRYAALLGGLSLLADPRQAALSAFSGANPFAMADAFARDWIDGTLDGKDVFGNVISVSDGQGQSANLPALSATAGDITPLLIAANRFTTQAAVPFTVDLSAIKAPGKPLTAKTGSWQLTISGTQRGSLLPGGSVAIPPASTAPMSAALVPAATDVAQIENVARTSFGSAGQISNLTVRVLTDTPSELVFQVTMDVTVSGPVSTVLNMDLRYAYRQV